MHKWMAVILVVLFATSLPMTSAQDESFDATYEEDGITWTLIGEDAADDNDVEEGTQTEQDVPAESTDLRALYVAENQSGALMVRLHVQDLKEPEDDEQGLSTPGYQYYVYFQALGWNYELYFSIDPEREEDRRTYSRLRAEAQECCRWEYYYDLDVQADMEGDTITTAIPRNSLVSTDGKLVNAGSVFSQFYAESNYRTDSYSLSLGAIDASDRMPETGAFSTEYVATHGIVSSGHLSVFSPLPLRTSNGEATTFLFEVEVENHADFIDTVRPSWSGGLDTWTITFPDGNIRLEPGDKRALPFLVTVPFSHEHGAYHPFTVAFQSQADPEAQGRIELGILYTAVPQPAGHHPTVYLHGPDGDQYMNTIQDVDEDNEPETFTYSCGSGEAVGRVFPLIPTLSMGIDVDMDLIGEAKWLLSSSQDADGYSVEGFFYIAGNGEQEPCDIARGDRPGTVIANIPNSGPVSISGGQVTEMEVEIHPSAEGDYVPFDENQQLWLATRIVAPDGEIDDFGFNPCSRCLGEIQIMDGSEFFLPLDEYHDDVDDYFAALSGIDLYAANNSQERFVNPGETIIYRIEATNVGAFTAEFNLELTGANVEWAELLGDLDIKLKAGETRELAIAVSAPSNAVDEELADIVLHATLEDDPSIRSIIRLLTEVDEDEDHPDESHLVFGVDEELQRSPFPALPVLVALLAVGAVCRRHRI